MPRSRSYYRIRSASRRKYRKIRSKTRPSKGWKAASPKRGVERNALYRRCGSRCFLLPKQKKFPICSSRTKRCTPDCRGLLAALSRARQWKYQKVAKRARSIARRRGCGWAR